MVGSQYAFVLEDPAVRTGYSSGDHQHLTATLSFAYGARHVLVVKVVEEPVRTVLLILNTVDVGPALITTLYIVGKIRIKWQTQVINAAALVVVALAHHALK